MELFLLFIFRPRLPEKTGDQESHFEGLSPVKSRVASGRISLIEIRFGYTSRSTDTFRYRFSGQFKMNAAEKCSMFGMEVKRLFELGKDRIDSTGLSSFRSRLGVPVHGVTAP